MTVLTDVPEELGLRGIFPPERAAGFAISLDRAEPWGGGLVEGRVERRSERRDRRPIDVAVRCWAAWLDIAPQLVGKKRLFRIDTYWDLRMRSVPIWLEEEVFMERFELGPLEEANWLHFAFHLPGGLPRAFEGTFASFRWRIEARRHRRIGNDRASLPLLVQEQRTSPIVRIETSPIGTWRLLEWRSDAEQNASAGPCSVAFEERRPEDMPLPGETRETELARRFAG